jgi:hypothetical protein
MSKSVSPPLRSRLLALPLLFALGGCDGGVAVHHELYRAAPGEDLGLISAGCIAREAGGGAGGATNEYVLRQSTAPGGGMTLTYLLPAEAAHPEQPLDPDDPELSIAATLNLSKSDLLSGQSFMVEFDANDGTHFEAVHWGSADCDG